MVARRGARKRGFMRASRRIVVACVVVAVVGILATGARASGLLAGGDDPPSVALPTWTSVYSWDAGDGYSGWTSQLLGVSENAYGRERGLGGRPGLWLWPHGGRRYGPGGAEWVLRAPGTTRIASARIGFEYRNKLFAHHCLRIGLRSPAGSRSDWQACKPPQPGASQDHAELRMADPAGEPTAKELYVELAIPACVHPNPDSCEKWIPAKDPRADGGFVRITSADIVLVDDDDPVVRPSGKFFELDRTYIDGRQSYPLRVDTDDAGAGVTRIDVEHTGWPGPQPPLVEHSVDCDPRHRTEPLGARVCPSEDVIAIDVDTRPMPEGTRRFRAHATDVAGNNGDTAWSLMIDRTAPTPPLDLRFTTPEEGSAQAVWEPANDPALADGTPGSGVVDYRVRHQVGNGGWSTWTVIGTSDRVSTEIYDQPADTRVAFQAQAVDAVGNVSETVEVEGTVAGHAPYVLATGELTETDYIGAGRYAVNIDAADSGTGVRRVWLERDGEPVAAGEAGCTARFRPDGSPWKALCPAALMAELAVDSEELPEGAHYFQALAIDRAGNAGLDSGFSVFVDRSAPSAPEAIEALGFDAVTRQAELLWDDGEDPALPDGTAGSGVEATAYRLQRGGAGWTDWRTTEDAGIVVSGTSLGERLNVQLRSIDAVGNTSESVEAEVVVDRDGEEVETEQTPAASVDGPMSLGLRFAATATPKSAGARKVAKLNRRAHGALGKAISRPWGRTLRRADAALGRFRAALNVCTNHDRRPATKGCPGLRSRDIDVLEDVVPLYERMHAAHDRLVAFAEQIIRYVKSLFGQRPPTDAEIRRAEEALVQFAIEAAQLAGHRDPNAIRNFIKQREPDILDGAELVGKRQIHYNGGKYIARGARNPQLRDALRNLYRADARVGDGSTMDALQAEVKTGCRLFACKHYEKALGRRSQLIRILSDEDLSTAEREIAGELIGRLNRAISIAGGR